MAARCPDGRASFGERVATLVLLPPRETLYPPLDARFLRMLQEGALDEVRALLAMHLDPALPAMKAVGLRELAAHLAGETTLEAATAAAQQATRRFAKRQMTWLRHQVTADAVFFEQYSERIRRRNLCVYSPAALDRRPLSD